jgi:sarcosine oxidase
MKNSAPDVAVVGRGLIGSAAARHLSKRGCRVTLIGPSEPADYAHHDGVFGSHYDEGRITRRLEPHPYWMQMNQASISRYGEIAAESGIEFFREVGVLHIGACDSRDVALLSKIADAAGVPCEAYEGARLAERFPFLRSTEGMRGIFETAYAGYISPRCLVQAQTVAAQRAGTRIINEPALGLSESRSGVKIKLNSGSIEVERVLVTAGGHTPSLLGQSFGFKVFGRTVAMFRLGTAEVARLAGMPAMRCFGQRGMDPYILPPIAYPDGHTWLKLGSDPVDIELEGDAEIRSWFRSGGSSRVADGLEAQVLERIRDLHFEERRVVPCMTTFGDSGLPMIERISDRVAVAFGCYGKSAKCSDEMGRLGGMALLSEMQPEIGH